MKYVTHTSIMVKDSIGRGEKWESAMSLVAMFKRGISGMVGTDGRDWTGLDGTGLEYINVGSCGMFGQI